MIAALFIAAVVVAVLHLHARARRLEARLVDLERALSVHPGSRATGSAGAAAPPAPRAAPDGDEVAGDGPDLPSWARPRVARAAPGWWGRWSTADLVARLPFLLGAVSLAAAGVFLIAYSVQQGLLSAGVRVTLGALLGLGFLGFGLRRPPQDRALADGFEAAGLATLFAAILGATVLYGMLPPLVGLLLMGGTTAAAVGLGLRSGRIVPYVGLIGGMLAPALINAGSPNAAGLFVYLGIVAAGIAAVAARRAWGDLLAALLGCCLVWLAAWRLLPPLASQVSPGLVFIVYAWGLAALAYRPAGPVLRLPAALLPWTATPVALLVTGGAMQASGVEWLGYAVLALIGAGSFALARADRALRHLPWLPWGIGLAVVAAVGALSLAPRDVGFTLAVWAALYGLLPAALADRDWLVRGWRLGSPVVLLATFGAFAAFNDPVPSHTAWAVILGGVAAGYAALAAWRVRRLGDLRVGASRPDVCGPTDAFVGAAWGYGGLAVLVGVNQQWMLAGMAAVALAAVAFDRWLATRTLPRLAGLFAMAGALGACPDLDYADIPRDAVTGGLVPVTGLAVLALLGAATALARCLGTPNPFRGVQTLAGVAALTLAATLARLPFAAAGDATASYAPAAWTGGAIGLLLLLVWGTATGLRLLGDRTGLDGVRRAGRLGAALAALYFTAVPLTTGNPLLLPVAVGPWPVLNALALLFGVPALAIAFEAWRARRPWVCAAMTWMAVAVGLLFVTAEVRQAFHGSHLTYGQTSAGELYTYSVAWMSYAAGMLALGFLRRSRGLMSGGLLLMALAASKVFLYDASALNGLWRVLSFLGLGLTLMGIGHLFQRLRLGDALGGVAKAGGETVEAVQGKTADGDAAAAERG